jgi:hypothetical protein
MKQDTTSQLKSKYFCNDTYAADIESAVGKLTKNCCSPTTKMLVEASEHSEAEF